jgi:hypothetical protein
MFLLSAIALRNSKQATVEDHNKPQNHGAYVTDWQLFLDNTCNLLHKTEQMLVLSGHFLDLLTPHHKHQTADLDKSLVHCFLASKQMDIQNLALSLFIVNSDDSMILGNAKHTVTFVLAQL